MRVNRKIFKDENQEDEISLKLDKTKTSDTNSYKSTNSSSVEMIKNLFISVKNS